MSYDPEKQVNFKLPHHFLACVMGGESRVDNITYNSTDHFNSIQFNSLAPFMIMLPLLW
jgi:hypothetical protein